MIIKYYLKGTKGHPCLFFKLSICERCRLQMQFTKHIIFLKPFYSFSVVAKRKFSI